MKRILRLPAALITLVVLFTGCAPNASVSVKPSATMQRSAATVKSATMTSTSTPTPTTTSTLEPTEDTTMEPTAEPAAEPTPQPTPIAVVNEFGNSNGNIMNSGPASRFINVVGDWIYYAMYDVNGNIYKIRTDGTEKTKLNDEPSIKVIVSADWIYYLKRNEDNLTGKICKVKTDGSGRAQLTDMDVDFMNVSGEWVYYVTVGDKALYVMRTDGTGKTRICDDRIECMNISGNRIYYTNGSDFKHLYKMQMDGTGRIEINAGESRELNVVGDWIFFIGVLHYRMRTDGTEKTVIRF